MHSLVIFRSINGELYPTPENLELSDSLFNHLKHRGEVRIAPPKIILEDMDNILPATGCLDTYKPVYNLRGDKIIVGVYKCGINTDKN